MNDRSAIAFWIGDPNAKKKTKKKNKHRKIAGRTEERRGEDLKAGMKDVGEREREGERGREGAREEKGEREMRTSQKKFSSQKVLTSGHFRHS